MNIANSYKSVKVVVVKGRNAIAAQIVMGALRILMLKFPQYLVKVLLINLISPMNQPQSQKWSAQLLYYPMISIFKEWQ